MIQQLNETAMQSARQWGISHKGVKMCIRKDTRGVRVIFRSNLGCRNVSIAVGSRSGMGDRVGVNDGS